MSKELENEADKLKELLNGKSVSEIFRHRKNELCIQFSDGTRLFIDGAKNQNLEFSVTGGN